MTVNLMPTARITDKPYGTESMPEADAVLRTLLDTTGDCVKILDGSGAVCFMNEPGRCLMEIDDFGTVEGRHWASLWPESDRVRVAESVAAAVLGRTSRFDAFCPTAKGTGKWWEVTVAPMNVEGDEPLVIAISRDITHRVYELQSKNELLAEKDLLMQEIHHRVKNSLQLVQGLLSIQARSAGDDATARQLQESAARVRTISSMHDRLYRTAATLDIDIQPYLSSLISELESGMASTLHGRRIMFEAGIAVWTAADVPPLGLVLTELVTNALKYGEGTVHVTFMQAAGEQAVLTVEDEGPGLPADFDPTRSKGLGMKLVTNLLRERNGRLDFGRINGRTRFTATMPKPSKPKLLSTTR